MEKKNQESAAIRIPPPFYFLFCLGAGLLLEYFLPIYSVDFPLILRRIIGVLFIFISGYFALNAFMVLIKNKTPFDTSKSTVKIVKTGAFKYSRNPLYLSLLLLLSGVAVFISSIWLLFAVPILFLLLLFLAVLPEEKYLSQKFGREYLDYMKKVRRWI